MSEEFHYVRTPGADGGVDVCEGPAIGLDLASILKDGLPPYRVVMEVVAALCEIVDISEQDGDVHGNLTPSSIFLDETGAVSVEGWNAQKKTIGPDQQVDALTDLYGIGYTAFRMLAAADFTPPTDSATAHDDAIVDAILDGINLGGLPEAWHGDVQWFLAKLMSFDAGERPPAIDVWKTFIAFADDCQGPNFPDWCAAALDGDGGERRDIEEAKKGVKGMFEEAPPPKAAASEEEDLGGPVVTKGPLKQGMDLGPGSAPKGSATAFWSKDAMKAALAAAEGEEEEEKKAYKPKAAAATSFWSKDQMNAMVDSEEAGEAPAGAPRPKKVKGAGQARQAQQRERPATPEAPPPPPPGGGAKPAGTPMQPKAPTGPQLPKSPPGPTPPVAPPIGGPVAPPPVTQVPPEEAGGSNMGLIIGVVVVLLLVGLGCVGIMSAGGLAVFLGSGSETATVTPAPAPAPAPVEKRDTGKGGKAKAEGGGATPAPAPGAKPSSTPKPAPKPSPAGGTASSSGGGTTSASAPKPAPAPAPAPTARPTPKPAPAPAPAPAEGPARVSLKANGRGTVACAGNNTDFDGAATITIDSYQLPATCLVTIEKKRAAFQVMGSGSINCNLTGPMLSCDKDSVGP